MKSIAFSLPYVISASLGACFVLATQHLTYWWLIVAGLAVLVVVGWLGIVLKEAFHLDQLVVGISLLLFVISAFGFYMLLDATTARHGVIGMMVIGVYLLLKALYYYHWKSAQYQPGTLQIQTNYTNSVTIFFLSTVLFAMTTFLNVPLWLVSIAIFCVIGILYGQELYVARTFISQRGYLLGMTVALTQLFVVIDQLPFLVYVRGFLFLISYVAVTRLFRSSMQGLWKQKEIWITTIIFIICVVVVLGTTRWF